MVMLADLDMTAQRSHKSLMHTYKTASRVSSALMNKYSTRETLHNLEEKEHRAAKSNANSKDFQQLIVKSGVCQIL